jgi:hypothetical protein
MFSENIKANTDSVIEDIRVYKLCNKMSKFGNTYTRNHTSNKVFKANIIRKYQKSKLLKCIYLLKIQHISASSHNQGL